MTERRFNGIGPEQLMHNAATLIWQTAELQRAISLGLQPSVVRSISKRVMQSCNLLHAQVKDVYREAPRDQ